MYHPRLKGSHYEMGLHYGEILRKGGQDFSSVLQLSPEQRGFGIACLSVCKTVVPELCQEIKGLAEGLGVSCEDLSVWLLTMYGHDDVHGCTCFCYTDSGNTYLARNSDMFPELKDTCESILYRPDKGYIFLGHSTSFIQIEDGINEHGLAAGINFLMSKTFKPGLNTGMIVRHVLESCRSVKEAIDTIGSLPIATTQNIILADRSGDMAVVESSPRKIAVRRPQNGEAWLVSANHFVSEEMQAEHANPEENWYRSCDRYTTVQTALASPTGKKDVAWAQELLGGKMGFICQYEKEMNFDTLWSALYDVSTLRIFRAEGNPSKTRFKADTRLAWGISKADPKPSYKK